MDSQHYNHYPHAYYRVGNGLKDPQMYISHMSNPPPEPQPPIVQSRLLEIRKEKSRDAARSRRGKENHEFYELAKMLPLPAAITSQLDKASIIRLTISYLKLRDFSLSGCPKWALSNYSQSHSSTNGALKNNKICNAFDSHQGTHILQSLDGFVFALGRDGRFLYISETVSIYLGLSQVELTGSKIFDYCHQADHAELALHLGLTNDKPSSGKLQQQNNFNYTNGNNTNSCSPLPPASVCSNGSSGDSDPNYSSSYFNSTSFKFMGNQNSFTNSEDKLERQFCIRMKSTLAKRGCQHFKSNGYRVVHVNAQLRPEYNSEQQRLLRSNLDLNNSDSSSNNNVKLLGLVAVAIALPPPSVNELRLEPDMFVMRLSLDFRINHCEPKVNELLDYNAEELLNRNFYGLVHVLDMGQIRKAHLDLIHKGQIMTKYYRIINKNGGYTWIQSCATLISNTSPQTSTPTSTAPANSNTNTPSPLLNTNASSPNSATSNSNTATGVSLNSSTSTSNNDEQLDQSIILINYVISNLEAENMVLDSSQLPDSHQKIKQQRITSKLQLTHSPPSPSPIQPPTKKMIGCKRQNSISLQSTNNLASPVDNSNNNSINLCAIKRSPNSPSPCQSPTTNLRHNQLLPIYHNSSNSDEDAPCSNENNHNTINSIEVLNGVDLKRRRYLSSPVRPWKSSPSPISNSHLNNITVPTTEVNMSASTLLNTQHLLLNNSCQMNNSQSHNSILHNQQCNLNPLIINSNLNCSSPESASSSSSLNGSSSMTLPNNSSLLRHISVIRETPPVVLKSQLVQHYPHHQQNYSIHHQPNHPHHLNNNHSLHHNQLMNNHSLDQHQQLTHDIANHLNSNNHSALNISTNGINLSHNNSPPVQSIEHIGQSMNLAISNNNMSHLNQQSSNVTVPSSTLLTPAMPVVASNQSAYHQHSASANTIPTNSNQISNSIHHSLNNHSIHVSSEIPPQALNSNSNHSTLMHQAAAVAAVTHPLAANVNHHSHHHHHSALTHSNHPYSNPLTNPLNQLNHHSTHHHHSLVDPYSSYSSSTAAAAAAAAAALHHHWTAYK